MTGTMGRILIVDLSTGTHREEIIPDEMYRSYLAGVGLGAAYLYEHIPAGADPLGPDNILGFVAGILTGTGALFSGRWLVVGKSPLTGGWGDANCGGTFGPGIKSCGYDAIFVHGQAERPVTIYADGSTVEIRDASHLWGLDAVETEARLIEAIGGKRVRVACIGQSGENRSLIAGIVNDRGRIAARSGLGAVMGSKNLKAIVLNGSQRVETADVPAMKRLNKAANALIPSSKAMAGIPGWILRVAGFFMKASPRVTRLDGLASLPAMRRWGTIAGNEVAVISGDAPVKNWAGSRRDYPSRHVNPDRITSHEIKKYHCYACPLGCGGIGEAEPRFEETHKLEYETATSFGALLLNTDLASMFTINELLNRAGLDSVSTGAVIALAIECFENGLIDKDDTGGLALSWGDSGSILWLVERIIAREGIGDVLADGVVRAVQRIGSGAEQYAIHAGGQELPMHDPRLDPIYGLHYVVEPTPGRHTIGSEMGYAMTRPWALVSWAPEMPRSEPVAGRYRVDDEKGLMAAANSILKMVVDGAGLCTFGVNMGVDRLPIFDYLNVATGWSLSPDDYMLIGKRVQTLRHLFNIKHGINPAAVTLSDRAAGRPPLERGPLKGRAIDIEGLRRSYWKAMGWDAETGVPGPDTLAELTLPAGN
jgi:aldehyde:ferredoxin oxidoreductase